MHVYNFTSRPIAGRVADVSANETRYPFTLSKSEELSERADGACKRQTRRELWTIPVTRQSETALMIES